MPGGRIHERLLYHAATEPRQKDDEFSGLEQLIGQRAEATHPLLGQWGKRCATGAVEGVAKPEHMCHHRFETRIIGVNEHQMCAPLAFSVGLLRPSATDAPTPATRMLEGP